MVDESIHEQRFAINTPAVACQIIEGEAILIRFDRGHYFSAQGSGAWAIELIENGLSVDELLCAFVDRFGIGPDLARQDVTRFLAQLITDELVIEDSGSDPQKMLRTRDTVMVAGNRPDYVRPELVKYTDLEDLLALDPIHDVVALPLDERFAELERAFESATHGSGVVTQYIDVGGRKVKLYFTGRALFDLLSPAVAHLCTTPGDPELTLCIADSESAGVTPQLDPESFGSETQQNRFTDPTSLRCTYVPESAAMYCFDPERRRGFLWANAISGLRPWDISSPFRLLFAWWAESVGAQLAHGAVIGLEHSAILLGGPSGSGKSTLTLTCIQEGLCTLGDDYVWVEPGDPPQACSLYCTAKLADRVLRDRFARLHRYANQSEGDKACLYLSGVPGIRLPGTLPLRAVAGLGFSGQSQPRVRVASAVDVLKALAPSSLLQLSGSTPDGLHRLRTIVEQTRSFVFEAGTDYAANAQAITELLVDLASHPVTFAGRMPRKDDMGSGFMSPAAR